MSGSSQYQILHRMTQVSQWVISRSLFGSFLVQDALFLILGESQTCPASAGKENSLHVAFLQPDWFWDCNMQESSTSHRPEKVTLDLLGNGEDLGHTYFWLQESYRPEWAHAPLPFEDALLPQSQTLHQWPVHPQIRQQLEGGNVLRGGTEAGERERAQHLFTLCLGPRRALPSKVLLCSSFCGCLHEGNSGSTGSS